MKSLLIVAQGLAAASRKSARAGQNLRHEFTDQELKTWSRFTIAAPPELWRSEPRSIQFSMSYMNQWRRILPRSSTAILAEMRKRGKENLTQISFFARGGLAELTFDLFCHRRSSGGFRAPPGSPQAMARRVMVPKNTGWAAPA